jgi:hypothetical protein
VARLKNQKESKNFIDRVSSLLPRIYAPAGTLNPTLQQHQVGFDSLINKQFLEALQQWEAARKIQPGVEKYDNFDQPGYSPDIEPYWDEELKRGFKKAKKEYHEREKSGSK